MPPAASTASNSSCIVALPPLCSSAAVVQSTAAVARTIVRVAGPDLRQGTRGCFGLYNMNRLDWHAAAAAVVVCTMVYTYRPDQSHAGVLKQLNAGIGTTEETECTRRTGPTPCRYTTAVLGALLCVCLVAVCIICGRVHRRGLVAARKVIPRCTPAYTSSLNHHPTGTPNYTTTYYIQLHLLITCDYTKYYYTESLVLRIYCMVHSLL